MWGKKKRNGQAGRGKVLQSWDNVWNTGEGAKYLQSEMKQDRELGKEIRHGRVWESPKKERRKPKGAGPRTEDVGNTK